MRNSRFFAALALALSACILVACFPKGYTDKEEKAQINAAVALTEKYTDEYAPDAYISKRDFCVLDQQTEGNPKLYLTDWAEGKFKDSKNHKNYSVYVNTKTGEVYTDHNWDEVDSYGRKLFYEQFEDAYKMNFTLLGFLTLPYKDGDNSFGDITLLKMLPGSEKIDKSFVKNVFFGGDYEIAYYVDVTEDCDMDIFRNADISALGKKARLHVRQYSEDDFYKKTSQGGPEFIDETKVLAIYDSDNPDEEDTKNPSDNNQSDGDVTELTEDIYRCDPGEVFAAMSDWQFIFSSGAGGWATELSVNPDGTFSGLYYDDDMGDTGSGYENGTRYECDFTGRFNEKILTGGPLIYKLIIDEMNCVHKPGTEEIIDGVRHIYTEPYGLEGLTGREDDLIFCDAGVVTQIFTEEERQWLSSVGFGCYVGSDFDYIRDVPEELPFAALLNMKEDQAFYSQNRSEKNKTYLVNMAQLPGLHNEKSTKNSDNTYCYVDENDDGSFRVINTCFKTTKSFDEYNDADTFVYDSLKEIYGKAAPAKDDVHISSPKDAYDTDYWKMIISGNYSDYAFWYPTGEDGDISCNARFTVVHGYETDTSYVYAYIIEIDRGGRRKTCPDAGIGTYYISSLALTGKDEKLSSAGEGAGAIRSILCEMQTPGDGTVLAKEVIMVSESNKDLIKKYHLENADFDNDYEMVYPDKNYSEYRLADKSYTPFYIQYPKDKVHKLCFSYDLDSYMGEQSPDNTRLMQLYLNKDGEIVYAYEVYTP